MKRLLIAALSLSLCFIGLSESVSAQTNSGLVVIDDASGTNGTNRLSGNCEMSGSGRDRLVTCTDLRPGQEVEVTDLPPETEPVATDASPAIAPAPESDTTSTPETTVATPTDQDADNLDDTLEPEAGLDPTSADTDGDYVADGDEFNLYQTDPTIADTDGDGALDGEELFGTHTDPLLWEQEATSGEAATEPAPEPAAEAAPVAETTTAAETSEPATTETAVSAKEAAYLAGTTTAPPPAGTTENLSATNSSLLGPDGTYRVSESSPPIITIGGETTGVSVELAPGVEAAPSAEPTGATETADPADTAAPVESAEPVAADSASA